MAASSDSLSARGRIDWERRCRPEGPAWEDMHARRGGAQPENMTDVCIYGRESELIIDHRLARYVRTDVIVRE